MDSLRDARIPCAWNHSQQGEYFKDKNYAFNSFLLLFKKLLFLQIINRYGYFILYTIFSRPLDVIRSDTNLDPLEIATSISINCQQLFLPYFPKYCFAHSFWTSITSRFAPLLCSLGLKANKESRVTNRSLKNCQMS